jgi:hypothetical protein
MGQLAHNFALPLWALVDRSKVEVGKSDMRGLAKELGRWLQHNFDITHKGVAIEEPAGAPPGEDPMLVVAGVPQEQWPIMIAIAQSKDCKLFLVLPNEKGSFTLKALDLPKA